MNLSSKKEISFWAKGDGNTYTLQMMKESDAGQGEDFPAGVTFVAGPEWKQYTFPFSAFQADGSDMMRAGIPSR